VWGGEVVEVEPVPAPSESAFQAEDIALDVVFEDDALLVVNKPPGLVVHPASGNWQGTLLNALLHRVPALQGLPRAGIVHRLDKDTSGLMVVARTLAAQTALVRALQAHSVHREYLALAEGATPESGTVDAPVGRHPRQRVKMAVVSAGKPARTHYRALERFAAHTLLECRLETGRTHQIRVHMQSLGHPLAGDAVYGGHTRLERHGRSLAFPRQMLHARKLALVHPQSGAALAWEAPPPADFEAVLAALRQLEKEA
jgi:23S rRNA pseudouridine1911/1915/1917 synthase